MRSLLLLPVALFALACGSAPTQHGDLKSELPAQTGPCATRPVGAYLVHSEVVGGDCPKLPDSVVVLKTQEEANSAAKANPATACAGTQTRSADQCSITSDFVCPDKDLSNHASMEVRCTSDATKCVGVMTMSISEVSSGNVQCYGTYRLTYEKQ